MEKEGRERERERCGTALTFIVLVNSVEYQWTQPQLHQNGIESSSCFPYHTIPDRFLPSSRNCTHRYRPVSIDIDSIHWNTARVTTDIYLQDIYIYLFYLLFVLPPPTRSTNLTRIFFASSLERTEGGLTRGRRRMDKQRKVIDGWERLEGGEF